MLAELAELNRAYEERFGFRFVVFVNRRSRSELLPVLRERLARTREQELQTGIEELVAIARDRWASAASTRTSPTGSTSRPLAPRDRRDRLDRHVVLLRRARQPPAAARRRARPRARRRRRDVGDPRRRLLPDREVPRRAAVDARAAALVQVGGVHDVAVGLRAVRRPVLPAAEHVPDRPERRGHLAGGRDRVRASRCSSSRGSSTTCSAGRSASAASCARPLRARARDRRPPTASRSCSRRARRISRSARCSGRSWSRTSSS